MNSVIDLKARRKRARRKASDPPKGNSKGDQQSEIEQQDDIREHEPHNEDDLEIESGETSQTTETFQEHLP